jgi:hypothetical protein
LAIREHAKLHIDYQSMNRPGPTEREISPHAIGFDGFRWHTRAYCHEHKSFRDFVIARILKVHGSGPSEADHKTDASWHQKIDLVLAPHPDLSPGQKTAVALDYGMKNERLVLGTRRALAFYALRQLGLDRESGAPRAQHIVLLNREEVDTVLSDTA